MTTSASSARRRLHWVDDSFSAPDTALDYMTEVHDQHPRYRKCFRPKTTQEYRSSPQQWMLCSEAPLLRWSAVTDLPAKMEQTRWRTSKLLGANKIWSRYSLDWLLRNLSPKSQNFLHLNIQVLSETIDFCILQWRYARHSLKISGYLHAWTWCTCQSVVNCKQLLARNKIPLFHGKDNGVPCRGTN